MPIQIHGKPYYTVVERLKMLKADFKLDYSLTTELLKCDDKVVIVKATLSFGGNEYTGLALEIIGSSKINTNSYLMNCETSAIGRSLSAANYLGTEYCSANEMESAIDKEKPKPKPIPKDVNPLEDDLSETQTIHSKDGETLIENKVSDEKRNKGDASASQISYIKKLCKDKGIEESKYINGDLSKKEASDSISELLTIKKVPTA